MNLFWQSGAGSVTAIAILMVLLVLVTMLLLVLLERLFKASGREMPRPVVGVAALLGFAGAFALFSSSRMGAHGHVTEVRRTSSAPDQLLVGIERRGKHAFRGTLLVEAPLGREARVVRRIGEEERIRSASTTIEQGDDVLIVRDLATGRVLVDGAREVAALAGGQPWRVLEVDREGFDVELASGARHRVVFGARVPAAEPGWARRGCEVQINEGREAGDGGAGLLRAFELGCGATLPAGRLVVHRDTAFGPGRLLLSAVSSGRASWTAELSPDYDDGPAALLEVTRVGDALVFLWLEDEAGLFRFVLDAATGARRSVEAIL
jgi:hypothetical protein